VARAHGRGEGTNRQGEKVGEKGDPNSGRHKEARGRERNVSIARETVTAAMAGGGKTNWKKRGSKKN